MKDTRQMKQSGARTARAGSCRLAFALLIVAACWNASSRVAFAATTTTATRSADAWVRMPGHLLDALPAPADVPDTGSDATPITLTLVFKRDDPAGFSRYLADVYRPGTAGYRHFFTQQQISDRFGPSRPGYAAVGAYLRGQGFRIVQSAKNRMTLTVRGTRATAEKAFAIEIHDYQVGAQRFFANAEDPALPNGLAQRIASVSGLENLARPHATHEAIVLAWNCINDVISNLYSTAEQQNARLSKCYKKIISINYILKFYDGNQTTSDPAPGDWVTLDGSGQKVGLLEFDSFVMSDVANYLTSIGAPASQISNLTAVPVNGGTTPGANQDEVLLDIDTVMTGAPGAKVVVYDAPFTGQAAGYSALFNAMINDGVTIISNSWASCEDQVTAAEAQSIDAVLQTAAASGISVFNGAGDSGSTCLDGAANTVAVPADSPSATAVGGTSIVAGPGDTYGSETWWNGTNAAPPTGQGGFGVSKFFTKPAYQNGLNASGARSVPDVVSVADPANGVALCQATAGGCPTGLLYGGTSYAAPSWAVFAAILNQAHGSNLGAFNAVLYPFANSNGFHSAASMGSDFAHVGLGSPNLNALDLLITGSNAGAASAATSQVGFYSAGGFPSSSELPVSVTADGSNQGFISVILRDAATNVVPGRTVTLSAGSGSAKVSAVNAVTAVADGSANFAITDTVPETLTFTATDSSDGVALTQTAVVTFVSPPAASGGISANPPTVAADGQSATSIVVTLKDSMNRPSAGKVVSIADAGAHAVISGPSPAVTDANGQIQFTATDQVNETVAFTALDVSDDLPVPGSASVTYSGSANTACGLGVLPVAGTGYTISTFATGFPAAATVFVQNTNIGCPGADNPTFTASGNVLVADFLSGAIYQLSLAGGAVSNSNVLNTLGPGLGNIIYGKDGSAYATFGGEGATIVRIDPVTGVILSNVATGLTCPAGLSVDPLSGDLFFDDQCTGGGTDDPTIYRIIDPANTDVARPTSVVPYATLPSTPNGGMAFAPNGTLYAVTGYYQHPNAPVEQISGTNVPSVSVAAVTGITSDYSVAIGVTNADGSAQSLLVEPAGTLSQVPIASPATATVLATGSPGVGVTGPDGCLYSAHYDTVYRLANTSGGCSFAPTSPAPSIKLTPVSVTPNPAQGSTVSFTATLQNVSPLSGVAIYFTVTGANTAYQLVTSDANGHAVFSFTAAHAGNDVVSATAAANSIALSSNNVPVTWVAGKHTSYLSLNTGPRSGALNQPVTVIASLADVSTMPASALPAASIQFSLAGSTCTAATNSAGAASCQLTPTQPGASTLTANFAGSGQVLAASIVEGFHVAAAPTPPPTVNLAVNPTSVAAGSPAILTWSSDNATACVASGAWSGTQATSGTATVTPATTGSFTYTLTCSGAGGSTAASAVLSATLVSVTVTAKSGGGAITWPLLLLLGALLLLRLRAVGVGVAATVAIALLCTLQSARADTASAPGDAAGDGSSAFLDHVYGGIRVGSMPVRLDSANIDAGLTAVGYPGVHANTDTAAIGGTLFLGYALGAHADVEFGYTHRNSHVATLSGTTASAATIGPLLQDTTELVRGYGNIFSLSFRPRFEVAPRLLLDPRIGAFFWDTKVTADAAALSYDRTHAGGGLTLGAGVAYRVWRGLELGFGVDYFKGSPNNVATLYGGSLEWRFGH